MLRVLHPRLRFIEPQLPSLVDQPPGGKHWIHEIKHDGYRSIVIVERGQTRVYTRNGHDWTERYPAIVRAASNLRCKSAIIDGEALVQDGNGTPRRPTASQAVVTALLMGLERHAVSYRPNARRCRGTPTRRTRGLQPLPGTTSHPACRGGSNAPPNNYSTIKGLRDGDSIVPRCCCLRVQGARASAFEGAC